MRQRADGAVVAMNVDSGVIVMYAIVGVNNCVFVGEDKFAAMSVWARASLSPPCLSVSLSVSPSLSLGKLPSRTLVRADCAADRWACATPHVSMRGDASACGF